MALRPPRLGSGSGLPAASRPGDDPLGQSLDREIMAEKFATHGRLVEKVERLIARLAEAAPGTPDHARLTAEAGQAVWHLAVQRDLLRLPATDRFLAELGVPASLRARVAPPQTVRRRRV